jgi:predicted dehydrogenase
VDLVRSGQGVVRAALIGAGQIARQHLACLHELPGVNVVGVCDLSRARAECAAERFGISASYTDSRSMLNEVRPEVVHVTTPPTSHFPLALAALNAGAHVIVEKPVTLNYSELEQLADKAAERGLALVENHNYLFNGATRRILDLIISGNFGDVTHVEVFLCLDILGKESPFCDLNALHPTLGMPGGAIADFLTHLAYLAYAFIGFHRSARASWSRRSSSPLSSDEFRALVDGERGTATLAFSANTRPDAFWLRVYGTKMQAVANLFETRLTVSRLYDGPKPLTPFRNALQEARDVRRSAFDTLLRKLSGGPGAYEGLWELLARTYRAIRVGAELPVPMDQVLAVNRLVADLTPGRS